MGGVSGSHWVAGGRTPPNQGGDTYIQPVPPQKKSPHFWRLSFRPNFFWKLLVFFRSCFFDYVSGNFVLLDLCRSFKDREDF